MNLINCTPWDFAGFGMPRALYCSAHFFGAGLADWIARNPGDAYLIDAELFDDRRDIDGLADVLSTFDTHAPSAKRYVYRSLFRCTDAPQELTKTDLAASMADTDWEYVNRLTHAFVLDVYLMGVPVANYSPRVNLDRTLAQIPEYLDRNKRVGAVLSGHTAVPCIPCIHERYHVGHKLAPWVWQTSQVWRTYVQAVRQRWTGAAWWSGSIQEPGLSRYFTPRDSDLIPFASIAAEVFRA